MNETPEYRERFPGVEIIPDIYNKHRTRAFSAYQKERTIIECMEDVLWDMDTWDCIGVVVKDGEHWWDCKKYYNRDEIVSLLFDKSLSRYVTKFDIERLEHDKFILWVKLHSLTNGLETNLGADLIEYIGDMIGE